MSPRSRTGSESSKRASAIKKDKNLKSTGVHEGMGVEKWLGVVPTKFHPNRFNIAKVCFRGGFGAGGVG